MNVDPWVLFALGALCMLTLGLLFVVVLGYVKGKAVLLWLWGHASAFDSLGARSAKGKVKLSGLLRLASAVASVPKAKSVAKEALFGLSEEDRQRAEERARLS